LRKSHALTHVHTRIVCKEKSSNSTGENSLTEIVSKLSSTTYNSES